MAEDNVDIVRRMFELNRSGPPEETLEPGLRFFHPDIEFHSRISDLEGASYRGHEGLRRYWADISDAFDDWRSEPGTIKEIAPGTVLATSTFRATGKSGVVVALTSYVLMTLRDGLVTKMYAHPSREAALEAAGKEE